MKQERTKELINGNGLRKQTKLNGLTNGSQLVFSIPANNIDIDNARPLYGAIYVSKNKLHVAETNRNHFYVYEKTIKQGTIEENIIALLRTSSQIHHGKYVAVGLAGPKWLEKLISPLWLQEDIVTFIRNRKEYSPEQLENFANDIASFFSKDNIVFAEVLPSNEVVSSKLVTLDDYKKTATAENFAILTQLAKEFRGKRMVFLSATPQGGGVALMRHALIRLYNLLGVNAHWFVLVPEAEAFVITKTKFHNVLQAVQPPGVELTDDDKSLFRAWTRQNAYTFEQVFKQADVIVVDDPQPSGLVPFIRKVNPKVKLIYRSHIQIVGKLADTEGTPQRKTWSFIWNNVKSVDTFVAHPIKEFVPSDVPDEKVVYMPATTDPLDGLNRPLTEDQMKYYMKMLNKILVEQEKQSPLDLSRPFILQIARFDPAKGIPDVIEAYRKYREMMEKNNKEPAQLVIGGNAAIDDPEGLPIFNETIKLLYSKRYAKLAADVRVVRLPHIDQLLNTLMRRCTLALQLSIKEGFEIKITEGLMKGTPMIAYRTGGIPWQIKDGVTGYLVTPGDTKKVAEFLYELSTNKKKYDKMSAAAAKYASKDYLTVPNALCWLYLSVRLMKEGKVTGNYQWVLDLAHKYYKDLNKNTSKNTLLAQS